MSKKLRGGRHILPVATKLVILTIRSFVLISPIENILINLSLIHDADIPTLIIR